MLKQIYKYRNRGFTLIELLVTIGIIGILAGIGVVTVVKIKGANNQTQCVSNLSGISQGMQLYYNDYIKFPNDGYPDDADDLLPLSTELANYIAAKSTFICPTDNDPTSIGNFASYDPYYIARKGSYDTDELAIGCPRHRGGNNSTSAFSTGSTEITSVGTVQDKNSQEIPQDGTTAQRTISIVNDEMNFADGSKVTVKNASGSYGCILVQSVQLADGTLYSIVRVQDNGTIDVRVTDGSRFEIVTPSAIVGVRGTQFTVQTSDSGSSPGYKTDVTLTTGTVILRDRKTGETTLLATGGTTVADIDVPMHTEWHIHEDGTYHFHEHPAPNNAHHGKFVPVPVSTDDATLLASINQQPPVKTRDLRRVLELSSPLSDAVLTAAIDRSDPIKSNDLKKVLEANSPLSDNILTAAINRSEPMRSNDLEKILIDESPLAANVLQAAIDRNPPMRSGDLQKVLDAQ